jgi:hypothetical protein
VAEGVYYSKIIRKIIPQKSCQDLSKIPTKPLKFLNKVPGNPIISTKIGKILIIPEIVSFPKIKSFLTENFAGIPKSPKYRTLFSD